MGEKSSSVRYPAIPLVVHDPYFSVWSFSDKLSQSWTRHWTGTGNGMCGMIRVDGETFRFCGGIQQAPEAEQLSVEVLPTRTVYKFLAGKVELTLTFMTPALPHDLAVLSRPVSYLFFDVKSSDGVKRDVSLHFDCSMELAVDNFSQSVVWGRAKAKGLCVLHSSNSEQRPLLRCGDNLRIDWGSCCLAAPDDFEADSALGPAAEIRNAFIADGALPPRDSLDMPKTIQSVYPCMAFSFKLGKVGAKAVRRNLLLAFNDIWSVEYLDQRLKGYWAKDGMSFSVMLEKANEETAKLEKACAAFDKALMDDCREAGGDKYAVVCALSYRQAVGAHKLVASADGSPFFFSKENFSNGCIATVDVTYPSAPLFLLLQPELLKGMMIPIMDYALKPRWKLPFAPHDLGTYPLANGQIYGGGESGEENQMPVEECGNMLLLAGALCLLCGELDFIKKNWTLLSRWAEYLREKGYDPEKQLCTDDFAGHLAHNANLSLKAILALAAFAEMAGKLGDAKTKAYFRKLAEKHAKSWLKDASEGERFRLAFDQKGSWSQKYNLVWDGLLGLELFPKELARKETAFYRKVQEKYGLPLDSRKSYTKLDWIFWSATLSGSDKDFKALTDPVFKWLNESPSRVPLTDWYDAISGKQESFQARSVVGGVFIKLLADEKFRRKWLPKR